MEPETAQNTSLENTVVQYVFRGNSQKQRKLLFPGHEEAFTCSKIKEAVILSNEINPSLLPPSKLCVQTISSTGETKG